MRETRLDQVFVRPRGGGTELLLVLETLAGRRERVTLPLPTRDPRDAVRRAGRHLARRGDVTEVDTARLRVERGGALRDDPALLRLLADAFADERDEGA